MNISSIKWSNITDNFEAGFKVAFSSDKKAHFDNLPEEYRVIDGAKGTWCNLLLLDAMIYILVNDSFNSSSRRAFNQHRVLCECVLTELRSISYEAYVEITDEKNNAVQKNAPVPEYLSRDLSQKYEHLTAHEYLEAPWDTMDSMRLSLIEGPPSKAKNKFCAIVDMLTNHTALSQFDFDFDHIIQTVISRALFVFKNHKVSLAPLISMYQMPSALTLNSSLLMTHEMLSMKRSVSKVTPTNKQKRTPTNKDLVVKSEIFPTADSSSNRKKTKAQLIFPVATQPVESADHSYMQACVPVQLAASLLPVMTGDLSDISDYDFDFLMNYIDGDEAVSPRPANTVETAEEHQAAAAKAKHIAEQLNRLKSKKVLKKVLKAQKESAPSVSIVIQKTDAEHLCAIIPVLPLKLLDTIETSSQDDSDSLASFGADNFEFFNDDAYALPNSFSPDGEEQESVGSTSQDSAERSTKITPTHAAKVTPTHAMTSLSISLPSAVARDDAVKEKKKRAPYVRKTSGTSGIKAPQSSVLIAIDPATTKYVLKDNVLCAIVPVLDPAMIAAHAAAIASEQSRKQQSLQISDADLEMLMGGCGGDDYSEGGTDGAATSGSDTCGSKSSQFSDQSPSLSMSLPCPPETWSGVSLSSMQTVTFGGANLRPFLLPPPMKMNRLNSLALETPLTFTDTNACISMATFELLSSLNPNQFMNFE